VIVSLDMLHVAENFPKSLKFIVGYRAAEGDIH